MQRFFKYVALLIVVIGALNMGVWGLFQFDIIAWLCEGNSTMAARLVDIAIGLAGIYLIFNLCNKKCKNCGNNCDQCSCKKTNV